jgi:hypothetical protein
MLDQLKELVQQGCLKSTIQAIDQYDERARLAELAELTAEHMLELSVSAPTYLTMRQVPYVPMGHEPRLPALDGRTLQLRFGIRVLDHHRNEPNYVSYFRPEVNLGLLAVVLEVTLPEDASPQPKLRLLYGTEELGSEHRQRATGLISIDTSGDVHHQRYLGDASQPELLDAFLGNVDVSTAVGESGDSAFQRYVEVQSGFFPSRESQYFTGTSVALIHLPHFLVTFTG